MRILVVDDHELVRKGMCAVLASKPELDVCGEAVDGRDAIERARVLHPDMVVIDISMPNMNGLEATREIRRLQPNIGVIIVSQHETPEMVRQAFNAGASGYVVKSAISKDLLTAIQKVGGKSSFVSSGILGANVNLDPQEILQRSAAFEKALRESEERFRFAMNNMAEGLYTLDGSGLVTYVNPAAEKMLGWTAAELLGKKMHDVAHYKHPDGTPFPAEDCAGLKALRSGKEIKEHEDVFIRKDGKFLPVVFSATPLKQDGQSTGLVICFRDDTKRRQAEKALRESERIYRAIAESIDYGIWICDARGRNTYVSPSFVKFTGITQEHCADQGWWSALHPDDVEAATTAWERCIRNGAPWEHEFRIRRVDGTWRWVLSRGVPIRDGDENITYWAGILLDVQHRKEFENSLSDRIAERTQALQGATDRLRKLSGTLLQTQDEERRRIARELHDGIGQLLVAMSMNIAGVETEKDRLSEAGRRSLGHAVEMIEQASQEIRTMSHLLHPPLLDEMGLESALRWYIGGFASRSNINVTMQAAEGFSDGLPRELALTLFRIVQESLTNVHRHSESHTAQVEIERSDRDIVLEVRDQGKGISPQTQSSILCGASFGVGLRGMQERTRQFNGHLEIESTPGDTRIRAVLPIAREERSEQPDEIRPEYALPDSVREVATVLCVDDEEAGSRASCCWSRLVIVCWKPGPGLRESIFFVRRRSMW